MGSGNNTILNVVKSKIQIIILMFELFLRDLHLKKWFYKIANLVLVEQ